MRNRLSPSSDRRPWSGAAVTQGNEADFNERVASLDSFGWLAIPGSGLSSTPKGSLTMIFEGDRQYTLDWAANSDNYAEPTCTAALANDDRCKIFWDNREQYAFAVTYCILP